MTGPAIRSVVYLVLLVAVEAQTHFPRLIQLKGSIERPAGDADSVHRFNRPVARLALDIR